MVSIAGRLIESLLALLVAAIIVMSGFANAAVVEDDMKVGPAGPVGLPQGPYNQQLWWIPVQSNGNTLFLEAMIYSPPGTGPFPLAVISHGKPAPGTDTRSVRPGFQSAAHWFVDRGFVVAVLLRRGYGRSQGEVADMAGTCATMDYVATAEKTALDIDAAIDFMTRQDNISGQVLLVGHSHGGFGDLGVAASPPKGVVGVVNFAGGTGNWGAANPWERVQRFFFGSFCNGSHRLLSALTQLGRLNSLPQIWLYAPNDKTFNPDMAQAMLDAYQKTSHAPITFVSLPSFKRDGHMLFADEEATVWARPVNEFLKTLNILGVRTQE
jgi:dienelactone hydrolase